MKKLKHVITTLAFILIVTANINAQIKVNVNLNVLPDWGPAKYERVDYYYMPEYDIYYNANQRQFIYLEGKNWVFANELPNRYAQVNLYNTYKVVINEPKPYLHHDVYVVKYKGYKKGHYKQLTRKDYEKEKHHKKEKHEHEDDDD